MSPEMTIDWENIQCEKCGMCCPNSCRWKKGVLCTIHPSITGDYSVPGERGILCHLTPLRLFEYGGYCPPVVRMLSTLAPELKIIKKVGRNGQVSIKNYKEVLEMYMEIRDIKG